MQRSYHHESVLFQESLAFLSIRPGAAIVDVTSGGGGHLRAIAQAVGPLGRVIGLDRDPRAHQPDAAGGVALAYPDVVHLHQQPFSSLKTVLEQEGITQIDGILCDLGVSSVQLDQEDRGFSFLRDGPLDMRMDTSQGEDVYALLSRASEKELADILYVYGEEWRSRRIARAIKQAWPLPNSTLALADVIAKSVGRAGRIHPATKSFQALRIAVNAELEELKSLLALLPHILAPKGRAVIISFHSLEDRLVKLAFREGATRTMEHAPFWNILTKKPVMASEEEEKRNPRSRSAKLRAVERC